MCGSPITRPKPGGTGSSSSINSSCDDNNDVDDGDDHKTSAPLQLMSSEGYGMTTNQPKKINKVIVASTRATTTTTTTTTSSSSSSSSSLQVPITAGDGSSTNKKIGSEQQQQQQQPHSSCGRSCAPSSSSSSSPFKKDDDDDVAVAVAAAAAARRRRRNGGVMKLPFPLKLHQILKDMEDDGGQQDDGIIASWLPDGKSFRIYNETRFRQEILGNYFRHTKFTSFIRQLYIYGFAKIDSGPNLGAYFHPKFIKNDRDACLTLGRHQVRVDRRCKQIQLQHHETKRLLGILPPPSSTTTSDDYNIGSSSSSIVRPPPFDANFSSSYQERSQIQGFPPRRSSPSLLSLNFESEYPNNNHAGNGTLPTIRSTMSTSRTIQPQVNRPHSTTSPNLANDVLVRAKMMSRRRPETNIFDDGMKMFPSSFQSSSKVHLSQQLNEQQQHPQQQQQQQHGRSLQGHQTIRSSLLQKESPSSSFSLVVAPVPRQPVTVAAMRQDNMNNSDYLSPSMDLYTNILNMDLEPRTIEEMTSQNYVSRHFHDFDD